MKLKHNKKRNTAFLFEALVREMTRAAIRKDQEVLTRCKEILKEHFSSGTVLYEELKMYRALYETKGLSSNSAQKLMSEVRVMHNTLLTEKKEEIFKTQSLVIKEINHGVTKNVFSNFVPNYKNIATVYQILNGELPPAQRVLLEETICESLVATDREPEDTTPTQVNNLVIKNFIKKFNKQYSDSLHEEQSHLLNNYVLSFSDNGLALKAFLNEEVGRLRTVVSSGLKLEEVSKDEEMVRKTNKVLSLLDECKERKIDREMLETVLKIQQLAREIQI